MPTANLALMSAQIVALWGGPHEHRIRIAAPGDHSQHSRAMIIKLPDLRTDYTHAEVREGFRQLFRLRRARERTAMMQRRTLTSTILRVYA